MTLREGMAECFERVQGIAPDHAMALHIRHGRPSIIRNNYPAAWRDLYSRNNFILRDPVIHWGLVNDGTIEFDELKAIDPSRLIEKMNAIGFLYGFAAATGQAESRSLGGFVRKDRKFTTTEKSEILCLLRQLHTLGQQSGDVLTPGQIEALALVAKGKRHAAAAHALGITESALKARLKSARENIGARTTAEAVQMACALSLIG